MVCKACGLVLETQKQILDDELCNYCLSIGILAAEELDEHKRNWDGE